MEGVDTGRDGKCILYSFIWALDKGQSPFSGSKLYFQMFFLLKGKIIAFVVNEMGSSKVFDIENGKPPLNHSCTKLNRVLSPVLCILALMLLVIPAAFSQQKISDNRVVSIPDKALDNIRNHASMSNSKLERRMTRYFSKLAKRENKLKKALFDTDSH